MAKKTNYKRLWRNAKAEVVRLSECLTDKEREMIAVIDVLEQVRDGLIKPDDIFNKGGKPKLKKNG